MTCILKTPNMLKQIQKAVEEKTPTKLIIESFQKRGGLIFTSERTSLELDVEVLKKNYLTTIKIQQNVRDDMYITYAFLNSIQMTSLHTICMCVDNVREISCG